MSEIDRGCCWTHTRCDFKWFHLINFNVNKTLLTTVCFAISWRIFPRRLFPENFRFPWFASQALNFYEFQFAYMWDSSIFHMTLKGSLSRKVWNVKRDFPPKKPRLTRDVAEFLLSMLNKIVIKCIRMMIFIVDILEIRSIYDLFICFHLFSRTEKVCSSSIRKKGANWTRNSRKRLFAMSYFDMCEKFWEIKWNHYSRLSWYVGYRSDIAFHMLQMFIQKEIAFHLEKCFIIPHRTHSNSW